MTISTTAANTGFVFPAALTKSVWMGADTQSRGAAIPALPADRYEVSSSGALTVALRSMPWRIPFEIPWGGEGRRHARLACLDTMAEFRSYLDPSAFPPEIIAGVDELIAFLSQPIAENRQLDKALMLAVGLMDIIAIDEMAAENPDFTFCDSYTRHVGLRHEGVENLVLPRAECALGFEALEDLCWREIKNARDIHAYPEEISFYHRDILHHGGVEKLRANLEDVAKFRHTPLDFIAAIDCGAAVRFMGFSFFPKTVQGPKGWRKEQTCKPLPTANLMKPPSPLPRQEFWRALLRSGISLKTSSLIERPGPQESAASIEAIMRTLLAKAFRGAEHASQRQRLRRLSVLVHNAGNAAAFSRFEEAHAHHYARILSRKGMRPHVLLTRSGVSANEIAIRSVADLSGSRASAYANRGWYHENMESIARSFPAASEPEAATACFVNLLPCNPESFMHLDTSSFVREAYIPPGNAIKRFLAKARKTPALKHYLVIDKTSDLLFALPGHAVPKNTTIIETASLTKHQRGERNYFYGLVASFGGAPIHAVLAKAKSHTAASLAPSSVVNLPRLSASEIQKRRAHFQHLHRAFAEGFAQSQQSLPLHLHCAAEAHDTFVYMLPPIDHFVGLVDILAETGVLPSTHFLSTSHGMHGGHFVHCPEDSPFRGISAKDEHAMKRMGIFCAESFGLDTTRLCILEFTFKHRWTNALAFDRDLNLVVPVFRAAMGFRESGHSAYIKGEALGRFFLKRIREGKKRNAVITLSGALR